MLEERCCVDAWQSVDVTNCAHDDSLVNYEQFSQLRAIPNLRLVNCTRWQGEHVGGEVLGRRMAERRRHELRRKVDIRLPGKVDTRLPVNKEHSLLEERCWVDAWHSVDVTNCSFSHPLQSITGVPR